MPIYEYTCNACGNDFETLVRSGSVPDCPACHATDLAKKLSVFASPSPEPMPAATACGMCGNPGGPGPCAFE